MVKHKKSASSSRWLDEYWSDQYVLKAKKDGLRSRAWFKLDQIHQTHKIFQNGMTVIDLGAAPGSWSQYAANKVGHTGRVIGCDLLMIDHIIGVDFFHGNFQDIKILHALLECVGNQKVQVIMSDMAPNMSGQPEIDIPKSMDLVEGALDMCRNVLAYGGSFIVKVFQGKGFDEYLKQIRSLFVNVKIIKPNASRARSREMYIVATKRKR